MNTEELLKQLQLLVDEYKSVYDSIFELLKQLEQNYKSGCLYDAVLIEKTRNQFSVMEDKKEKIDVLTSQVGQTATSYQKVSDFDGVIASIQAKVEFENQLAEYQCFMSLYSENEEANRLLYGFKNRLHEHLSLIEQKQENFSDITYYMDFVDIVRLIQNGTADIMKCMQAVSELAPHFGQLLVGHALLEKDIRIDESEFKVDSIIYDEFGYDQYGYDRYGFNSNGYDRDGFDIYGIDSDGYDILGYDQNGFNREGVSKTGKSEALYGRNGLDIVDFIDPHGYDRNGYDENGYGRDGYNEAGYDYYGYDKDGCDINGFRYDGYDRYGYDINGYTKDGYNRDGYNRDGYNKRGYNINGYNREGFDYYGYNEAGYNKDGYDKDGYDIDGYDVNGKRKPDSMPIVNQSDVLNYEHEDLLEKQYFKKCVPHITKEYRQYVTKTEMERVPALESGSYVDVYDREGFWVGRRATSSGNYYVHVREKEKAEKRIRLAVEQALDEPYFAHIAYSETPELYIGKAKIFGWVIDWADKRAQYYYQRDIYANDTSVGLEYVRDIAIKNRNYSGFTVLFSKTGEDTEELIVTDQRLIKIIEENRKNKKTHDIIASIQKKQYEIISADQNKNYVVNGCAGSGKTMIMMHRIRYLKYNNPDLNMKDVFVLSPTDILGRESKELSKLLQIDQVKQYNTASFYKSAILGYMKKLNIFYNPFSVIEESDSSIVAYEKTISQDVKLFWKGENTSESRDFYKEEIRKIVAVEKGYCEDLECDSEELLRLYDCYRETLVEKEQYSEVQVSSLLSLINHEIYINRRKERFLRFIEALNSQNIFSVKTAGNAKNAEDMFGNTEKLFELIIPTQLHNIFVGFEDEKYDAKKAIQFINLFIYEQPDERFLCDVMDEWIDYSASDVEGYISYLKNVMYETEQLKKKRIILQRLLFEKWFGQTGDDKLELNPHKAFQNLLTLYNNTEEVLQKKGKTDPLQYWAGYSKLHERKECLIRQMAGRREKCNEYLFYVMLSMLDIQIGEDETISIPVSKAFVILKMFVLFEGPASNSKKYLFIDEYQDYSPIEIEYISKMFPAGIFNLYGDVNQCINVKGMKKSSDLNSKYYDVRYEIKENYRNAKEISEYVKKSLRVDNIAIGLSGDVFESSKFPFLSIGENDRVAVIVKEKLDIEKVIPSHYKINDFSMTNQIERGCLNIIPVALVKGLEFEKAIVFFDGMNMNQRYVACTRAISELYLVAESTESLCDTITYFTLSEKNVTDYNWYRYSGKLKKYGVKSVQDYLRVIVDNNERFLSVSRADDTKSIYIAEDLYKKHRETFDQMHKVLIL